jgi:general secretion pathway protein C
LGRRADFGGSEHSERAGGWRKTPLRWLAVLVGIGFAAVLVHHFWQLTKPDSPTEQAAHLARAPVAIAPVPSAPVPSQPELAAAGTASSVSRVASPLVLVATAVGRNASEGTAALGTDPRNPQTYVAGAFLANGARLAEIHSDHVILTRGNRRAALYLHGRVSATPQNGELDVLLTVGGNEDQPLPTPVYAADPISDYIRAVPSYQNELLVGYRVYPGTQSGPFRTWGLNAGDVVIAIGGRPLVAGTQIDQFLRLLAEGATLSASVKREGSELTLVLNGGDIVKAREARVASRATPTGVP